MKQTLFLGYGNIDRQDDGVAWHVLVRLADHFQHSIPDPDIGFLPEGEYPHFFFVLQLTPELSDLVSAYERVCFVDAHTGSVPRDVNVEFISSKFQQSPFTHHLTPNTLLSFCEQLYKKVPEALLVSVKGYQFNFMRALSSETENLVDEAVQSILEWTTNEHSSS